MKLTGIVVSAILFAANVIAQPNFNLTALNGTWYAAGLTDSFYYSVRLLNRFLNLTVSCPQVYITGNATNAISIQPSLLVGWWNATTKSPERVNVSLNGILTLENNGSNWANFSGQFSYLNASKSTTSTSSTVQMLDVALAGIRANNSSLQRPAFTADINVQVANGTNGTNVFLFSASNFTFTGRNKSRSSNGNNSQMSSIIRRDGDDDTYDMLQVLLVQNASSYDQDTFDNVTSAFGSYAANITHLNNTCSNSSSNKV